MNTSQDTSESVELFSSLLADALALDHEADHTFTPSFHNRFQGVNVDLPDDVVQSMVRSDGEVSARDRELHGED